MLIRVKSEDKFFSAHFFPIVLDIALNNIVVEKLRRLYFSRWHSGIQFSAGERISFFSVFLLALSPSHYTTMLHYIPRVVVIVRA